MVIFAMVFLIPLVSGLEFDNVQVWDDEEKEVTIKNAFGFGKEIAKITLLSEKTHQVIDRGVGVLQLVGEFEIINNENYDNVFKKMEFFDVKQDFKGMEREFEYRYRVDDGYTDVPVHNATYCHGEEDCVAPILYYRRDYKYKWITLEDNKINELPKGKIVIGIFLDVERGEHGDWIGTFFGERLKNWAEWTAGLNDMLTHYYHFNESSGTNVLDSGGIGKTQVNLTFVAGTGTMEFTTDGLFGGGAQIITGGGGGAYTKSNANIGLIDTDAFFISLWVNRTSPHNDPAFLFGDSDTWPTYVLIGGTGAGTSVFRSYWAGADSGYIAGCFNDNGSAFNHILWGQSGGEQKFYCDGELLWNGTYASKTVAEFRIGNQQYLDSQSTINWDEMAVFNRTLTPSEISDLYNNGAGIRYRTQFTTPPSITYPTNTTYSDQVTSMNYTQGGLAHCWYSLNSGTNSTPVTAGVNFTGLNSGGGSSTWRVYCNDSGNAITSDVVTFFVDVGVETFLKSPADALSTTDTTIEFEVNASALGSARLRNQTIYIYYSNSTLLTTNYSTISGLTSSRKFNYTFADGSYIWNAITEANSSSVFLNDWDTNRTFTVDSTAPIITITYPTTAIDFFKVNNNLRINWTVSDVTAGLDTCWLEYQGVNTTVTCNNNGTFINITNSGDKSAIFYANDTLGNQNSNSFNWSYKVFLNSETFNTTVYESQTQTYILNISSTGDETVTANFTFNGTNYTTTKEGTNTKMNFTFSHDLPIGVGTVNFNWDVFYGSDIINTTPQSQTVDLLNLSLCGLGGLNTPFLNFTAKDEATDLPLNFTVDIADWTYYYLGSGDVSKTYSYVNVNANISSYAFCATPNLTIQQNLEVKYSDFAGDYPLRTYKTLAPISNTTTNTVLYLLKSTDGQYVTFQVLSSSGNPIQNVVANASREIPQGSGNVVLIGSGSTDGAGAITFFVNPDFSHTFTFDGTSLGLPKRVETITPSKTEYTIYLSSGGAVGNTTFDFTRGMDFLVQPRLNSLQNGTTYNFNFTLNSSYWAVTKYGFTMLNGSGQVLGYNESTSFSSPPTLNLFTGENASIRMEYFWLVTGNYTNGTRTWGVFAENDKGFGLNRFFTDFLNYSNAGMFGLNDFSRTLIIFLVIFITIGTITMLSGLYSPGAILVQLFGLVYFFDVVLGMIINPVGAIPHFATILVGLLAIGYAVREVTR